MIPGVRLIILGRQGAGKGTQCVRLARHYVVPHISTGDMLRAAVKEGTEFGRKARDYMDAGELLPDEVMIGIVQERFARDDTRNRGYVLDGFPRTVNQAQALDELTAEAPLHVAVDLDVPEEVVLERLAGRQVCADCGANYSVGQPPRYDAICDACGGDVVQRADDTEEAIRRRLALYEKETAPLVAYYEDKGLLVIVDGLGDANEVSARLVDTIDATRTGGGYAALTRANHRQNGG